MPSAFAHLSSTNDAKESRAIGLGKAARAGDRLGLEREIHPGGESCVRTEDEFRTENGELNRDLGRMSLGLSGKKGYPKKKTPR